jgi:hypothetical protein
LGVGRWSFGVGRLSTKSRRFWGLKKIGVFSPLLAFREAATLMKSGKVIPAFWHFLKNTPKSCDQ